MKEFAFSYSPSHNVNICNNFNIYEVECQEYMWKYSFYNSPNCYFMLIYTIKQCDF